MSRENRMLILLFVGMAALFTFFRIRYPNLGGGANEEHPAMRMPLLRVACEAKHLPAVEKVARRYELEFGVQVTLAGVSGDIVPEEECDLVIRRTQPEPAQSVPLGANQFLVTIPPANGEKEGQTILSATVFSTTNARKQGASRFARYLLARDKGLPLLLPNKSAANADPWNENPQPTVLVQKAAFPFLQPELKLFEENEGVRLLLTTGNCAFLSRKTHAAKTVDAMISFGANCDLGVANPRWRPMPIPARQIILATPRQSLPFLDEGISPPVSLRLGGVQGINEIILKQMPQHIWPQRLRQLLAAQPIAEYAKPQSLLRSIAQRKIDVGIILEQPNQQANPQIRIESLPNAAARLPILFWISQDSNYRQLLSRLSASMSRRQLMKQN